MKLLSYKLNGAEAIGVLSKDGAYIIPVKLLGLDYETMNSLIEKVTDAELLLLGNAFDRNLDENPIEGMIPFTDVELLAPIPVPKQEVICVGVNYMEHAYESARYKHEDFNGERPFPVYFCKRCNLATPSGGEIDGHFNIQDKLDYEAELGVILRKDALDVAPEDAWDYVFGYTIINDVTSRELQQRHKQFYFGKSLDTFTCMGPYIILRDDLPTPPAQHITCRVNGEIRQDNNTSNMIFDIPYLISELSSGMCLKAGTIISTGTPSGVGMGYNPPKWLHSGDTVECSIEGIGILINTVK